MTGGYEDGYTGAPRLWGPDPASELLELQDLAAGGFAGWNALDAGCGEGKNSIWLAERGAKVSGIEVSQTALSRCPPHTSVNWSRTDIRSAEFPEDTFDLILAYGLLHCLRDRDEIFALVGMFSRWIRPLGWLVVCAFNDREQDLSAHPGFEPCLLPHEDYQRIVEEHGFHILRSSDRDLHETHPHNKIPHTHSMTRLIGRAAH